MKKILFFTSPIGLGHASRDVAVASMLKDIYDKIEVTFITSKNAARHIAEHGFNALSIYRAKSIDADDRGYFKHRLLWLIDYILYYRDCKVKASKVIDEYKPDLVISDEDFASIAVASRRGIKSILITDLFESRFLNGITAKLERVLNNTLMRIIRSADLVLVPMHGQDHDNVVYIGPIVRGTDKSREELREIFGFSNNEKVVTVSVGGTASGKFLIDAALKAYRKVKGIYEEQSKERLVLVIVTGPSLNCNPNGYDDVRVYKYISNMHELIYASDLLISLAGRSTIDEAVAYNTPAVFIPIKGHFEQEANAREHGFSYSDIEKLDHLMLEYLKKRRIYNNNSYYARERLLKCINTLLQV